MQFQKPNSIQTDWRQRVRALGSVISRANAIIHHPIGRTAKARLDDGERINIGHWYLIPMHHTEHDLLHKGDIGSLKDLYYSYHGDECAETIADMSKHELERWWFKRVCERLDPRPFSDEVLQTILKN